MRKNQSYPLAQLAKMIGRSVAELRQAIADESLACSMRDAAIRYRFDPRISRDAAIEYCVNRGINPARVK